MNKAFFDTNSPFKIGEFEYLTKPQNALFREFESGAKRFVIDSAFFCGKSTALILATLLQSVNGCSLLIVSDSAALIAIQTVLSPLVDELKAANIRIINALTTQLPNESKVLLIAQIQTVIEAFQKGFLTTKGINAVFVDDGDTSIAQNQLSLFQHLMSLIGTDRADILFVLTGRGGGGMSSLKKSIGGNFRTLRFSPPQAATCVPPGQFYFHGDEGRSYSLLYMLLKFELTPNSIVVLCQNINTLYRVQAFLTRMHTLNAQLINPRHPRALCKYRTDLFNSGQNKVLLLTIDTGEERLPTLRGVSSLVFFGVVPEYTQYDKLVRLVSPQPNGLRFLVISFMPLQNEEKALEPLNRLLGVQQKVCGHRALNPIFLSTEDIDIYRYRANNVLNAITPNHIKLLRQLEIKRVLLKSRSLRAHFSTHPEERAPLVARIQELSREIRRRTVTAPAELPAYLLPSFAKPSKRVQTLSNKENPVLVNEKQLRPLSANKKWKAAHKRISKPSIAQKKRAKKGVFLA